MTEDRSITTIINDDEDHVIEYTSVRAKVGTILNEYIPKVDNTINDWDTTWKAQPTMMSSQFMSNENNITSGACQDNVNVLSDDTDDDKKLRDVRRTIHAISTSQESSTAPETITWSSSSSSSSSFSSILFLPDPSPINAYSNNNNNISSNNNNYNEYESISSSNPNADRRIPTSSWVHSSLATSNAKDFHPPGPEDSLPQYKDQIRNQRGHNVSNTNHRIQAKIDRYTNNSGPSKQSLPPFFPYKDSILDYDDNNNNVQLKQTLTNPVPNRDSILDSDDNLSFRQQQRNPDTRMMSMEHETIYPNQTEEMTTTKPTVRTEIYTDAEYGTNNDMSTITESGAYMVEAVPVQSMILVTAQIMDESQDNNISSNNTPNPSARTFNDEEDDSHSERDFKNGPPGARSLRCCWRYIIFAIGMILVTLGITYFLGGFCIGTNCFHNSVDYSGENQQSISIEPTSSPSAYSGPRKPFQDQDELQTAVDAVLYKNSDLENILTTYGPIEYWDVSNIHNFQSLFSVTRNEKAYTFKADLSKWNMSSANDTSGMFDGAQKFTSDLSNWDVSSVVSFMTMFNGATDFQSDLSRWNVSSAESMSFIFNGARSFTSDLSRWDVSLVSYMDNMFTDADLFMSDLSRWNVSKVTTFNRMFSGVTNFTSDLSNWDISNADSMTGMFNRAKNFDTDVSKWKVSKVLTFDYAFAFAESFTGDGVDQWDVRNAMLYDYMFNGASNFDADLSRWNTTLVDNQQSMSWMFAQTTKFRGRGLQYWNFTNVYSTGSMFQVALAFDCDVSRWDVSRIVDMTSMFSETESFRGEGLEMWKLNETAYLDGIFCDALALNQSQISLAWNVSLTLTSCQPSS